MNEKARTVRFAGIRIWNNGQYMDALEFRFNPDVTLIEGDFSINQSEIAEALVNIGLSDNDNYESSVLNGRSAEVITQGERDLIVKYRKYVLLSSDNAFELSRNRDMIFDEDIAPEKRNTFRVNERNFLREMMPELFRRDLPDRELYGFLSAQGAVCHGLAIAFAFREMHEINIPIVLDSFFTILDPNCCKAAWDALTLRKYQIIVFGSHDELKDLRDGII